MENDDTVTRQIDLGDPNADIDAAAKQMALDCFMPEAVAAGKERENVEGMFRLLMDHIREQVSKLPHLEHENRALRNAWTGGGDAIELGTTLEDQYDGLLEALRVVTQKAQTATLARVVIIWVEGTRPYARVISRRPALVTGI